MNNHSLIHRFKWKSFSFLHRWYFFYLLIFLVLVTFTCKEEETPKPGNPDDLVYEGKWIGNTTQMKLAEFEIENISNRLKL